MHTSLPCMVSIMTSFLAHPHCSPLPLPFQPQITCSNSSALVCYILSSPFSQPSYLHTGPTHLASVCISDPPASYMQLMHYSAQAYLLTTGFVSLAHSTKFTPCFLLLFMFRTASHEHS